MIIKLKKICLYIFLGSLLTGCTTNQNITLKNENLNFKNNLKTIEIENIQNEYFFKQQQIKLEKIVFSDLKVVYTINVFSNDKNDFVMDLCTVDTEIVNFNNHQENVISSTKENSKSGVIIENKVNEGKNTDPFYINSIITYENPNDLKRHFHYHLVMEVKFNPNSKNYEITESHID